MKNSVMMLISKDQFHMDMQDNLLMAYGSWQGISLYGQTVSYLAI